MAKKLPGQSKRRSIRGVVVGNSMDKTVKVAVVTRTAHPRYLKTVKKQKIFFAHTEEKLELETEVLIRESRPYSKNVKWEVVENFTNK